MEGATDRQERLDWWQQQRLTDARIAVIGAGALGNEVLKNLSLMGIGTVHVYDHDTIERSNLSRTVLFDSDSLGASKAAVAAAHARKMNVNLESRYYAHPLDVVWDLGGGLLRGVDLVLGCLDNLEARLAIGKLCYWLSIPLIDGGIRELGGRIQLHRTGFGACMDCSIGSGERVALSKRYSCLKVVRSYQPQDIVPTVQVGSAIVAGIMSQEAVKLLHGRVVPFGSVVSWFGETNSFDVLKMVRRPGCATCMRPPPGGPVRLPLGAGNSVAELLSAAGGAWAFGLPSPFILRMACSVCGLVTDVFKSSHRCRDVDLYCRGCNSTDALSMTTLDRLDRDTPSDVREKSLRDLGLPCGALLFGARPDETLLFELSADMAST